MGKRLLRSLCAVGVLSLSAFGQQQNARVAAMGGADILPDISRTLSANPALINLYKNQVQVTFNAPIFGTVSAGNVLNIGLILNRGLTLTGFYNAAMAEINTTWGPADNPLTATQYYPHILLGMDFSSVQLGLDLFFERSATTYDDIEAGTGNETKEDLSINNPGVMLGVRYATGDIELGLRIGGGFPSMNAKADYTTQLPPPPATQTWKNETEKGSFLRAGGEIKMPLLSCQWTAGVDWYHEAYQFSYTPAGATQKTRGNVFTNNIITPYLGFTKEIVNKVLLVVQDRSAITSASNVNDAGNVKNESTTMAHSLSAGVEQQVAGLLGFDSLGVRGGLNCVITQSSAHSENNAVTPHTKTDNGYVTSVGTVNPYVGIGVSKGAFTLDLMLAPGSWNNGLVAGPQVGRVTATCRF
jgi:hypothetical protein